MVERILVVDDDADMRFVLSKLLEAEGFEITVAASGAAMRLAVEQEQADLVILDLGLPDENGLDLAKFLRGRCNAGIIMLTGKATTSDFVEGLESGADFYISKPFEERDLLARIRSVLGRRNRSRQVKQGPVAAYFGDWRFDAGLQNLTDIKGNALILTVLESRLLQVLIDNVGDTLTRNTLHRLVFSDKIYKSSRRIDVLVGRLRRRLKIDDARSDLIKSIRGVGYKFTGTIEYK